MATGGRETRRVYMDYAAASPVDERVLKEMTPYFSDLYGNPSSLHGDGRGPRKALDGARESVARLVNAGKKEEILFTSGGTEANNMAVKGAAMRARKKGTHIVTSTIEHISLINIMKFLQKNGFEVTTVPVSQEGIVDVGELERALRDDTILASIMYANNEIGTIQDVDEIGRLLDERDVLFHTDAVAATGKIPIDVQRSKIDLLTLSSNDIYGPKGVGALFVKEGTPLESVTQGGGQERGLRSGSENMPGIVGLGAAAGIAVKEMDDEARRLTRLRDRLVDGIESGVEEAYLNGHRARRLPNNANFRFRYVEGEAMLLNLDMMGISVSSSSPCTSKSLLPSHVLLACGIPSEEAQSAVQFTMGRGTTSEDVDYVLEVLPGVIKKLREMSPFSSKNIEEMRSTAGHKDACDRHGH